MKVITDSNETIDLGVTETSPTISITDYSRRVTDGFGVTTVVPRKFSRRLSVRMQLATSGVDAVQRRLAGLRATPARWVADDNLTWLAVRGFLKDFEIDVAAPVTSFCTLSVEGLAESETVADNGAEPAPASAASSLRLLQPVAVTGNTLVSSTAAENDHPAWSSTTNYAKGARVILTSTHRIYESAAAGNAGNNPAGTSGAWIEVAPTNRWAMFDEALGTATLASGSLAIVLNGSATNAIALIDVTGATVRVQAAGYDRSQAAGAGAIVFADLPNVTGQITVTVTGSGAVAVGTLLIGRIVGLGITEASPTAGIIDYSRKEVDDFGEVTVVQRAWAKRMAARALIRTDAVDQVANRIAAVRARPCLWIADQQLDSVTIYGFFKDFSIEVGERVSKLSLSVEGLSKAAPVVPGLPSGGNVAWPDVTDPLGTKPSNNADKTSENTSKDTAAIGGKPASDVLAAISAATAQQEQLTKVTIPAVNQAVADAGERITAARARADQAFQNAATVNQRVDTLIAEGGGGSDGVDTVARAEIKRVDEAAVSRDEAAARESVAIEARLGERVSASARDVTTAFAEADRALGTRTAALEAAVPGISSRVATAEDTLSDLPNRFATARRAADLEAQVNGENGSRLLTRAGEQAIVIANGAVGALASSVRTLEARTATRPNLQSNGGFERGLAGVSAPVGAVVVDDAASGKRVLHWAIAGETVALLPPINVQAGIRYTVSIDLTLSAATGSLRVDPSLWSGINGTGAVSYDTVTGPSWPIGTSSNGPRKEFSFTVPGGVQSIQLRLIASNINDPRSIDISRVKVEAGDAPATSYSADASVSGGIATLSEQAAAIVDLDGRAEVFWRLVGTTNDGSASISLSKKDGTAPLFYVGANMLIRGDLIVDGAVTLRTLNRSTMTAQTQASRTGYFPSDYSSGVAPVEGITGDMSIGDGGSLYFTINASQVGSVNGAITAAYPSVQLLDTNNNVLGDYRIPLADGRIGGLANYVVRAINLWGARVIRWRIVNRGNDQAYTHMNDPAVSLYWTAL